MLKEYGLESFRNLSDDKRIWLKILKQFKIKIIVTFSLYKTYEKSTLTEKKLKVIMTPPCSKIYIRYKYNPKVYISRRW